jgi:GTPase SAR1 family protein
MTSEAALADMHKVRILVVGDHGVGKTCLVHRLCYDQPPITSPEWTTGCQTEVKVIALHIIPHSSVTLSHYDACMAWHAVIL